MSQEKTLVVILCMHRCGSSLAARLLQRLGMPLGPFDLGESNDSNQYGHFEAQPFVALNREFQLQQFGFEGDLPDEADTLSRYCERDGHWTCEESITEEAIARGRDLIVRLMQSGNVCGFKDPRTVQVWPYWRRVFADMPDLKIVPLFLVRSPHEIAMSIFRRSQGGRDYAQALDVIAVHFRRMKVILDTWSSPSAVVQFDPSVCGRQFQHAAAVCGLNWSDAAFTEVYDASCRHHEVAAIEHPAQAAFEALTGLPPGPPHADNYRRLLADAMLRETTHRKFRRLDRDAARQQANVLRDHIVVLEQDNAVVRRMLATIPPLEARLSQTTCELSLIRNSRIWRVREALVNVLGLGTGRVRSSAALTHQQLPTNYDDIPRLGRWGAADQEVLSKPRCDGQDAQSPATGLHYCERKAHAGD